MTPQEKSFIESCFKGNLKSIKTCIEYKVNIHVADDWAIDIAARNGNSDIVKYLLENGVTDSSAAKLKILAYVVNNNDLGLLKYLIQRSDEYKTDTASIQWAAANGNIKALELLLPYITDLRWVYCNAAKHGHIDTIKFLNDNNIFELDTAMELVLNWASKGRQWRVIEFLVAEKIIDYNTLADSEKIKHEEWKKSAEQKLNK